MITRPNGKVYRPRKPPVADLYVNEESWYAGVIVVRTFDVDVARELARPLWGEVEVEESIDEIIADLDWRRSVPFSTQGNLDREWMLDEICGVPCVHFRSKWDA
jgi:hypothetical protein